MILAKPNETLEAHTRRVVKIARAICAQLQLPDELARRIELACWMHDVGKATKSFQQRMQAAQQNRADPPSAYPHALASFLIALAIESRQFGQQSPKLATAAVLSHHSPLHPTLFQGYEQSPNFLTAALRAWLQKMQPDVAHHISDSLLQRNPSQWLHQEACYPDGSRTLMEHFQRLPVREFSTVKAVLCLADWLASAQHDTSECLFLQHASARLQQYLEARAFRLHAYQQRVQKQPGARLYLHAPTGSGKTEALLLWAGESARIVYLLPTQATVNAMWRRLQRIYGRKAVGIAHARALLELSRDEEEPSLHEKLFSSVFATPITVATLDQYLLAHLHGRHWEIRRTLTRHATLLIDEIHAYEPYTLGLLQAALERDPPARLAIASATLPSPLRKTLGDAHLITAEDALWQQQRHRLALEDRSPHDALEDAVRHAAQGETVLFVVNLVPLAQQLYQQAKDLAQKMRCPPAIHLLHSRFIYRDRRQKEQAIQTPSSGTLLIATQVVEVSLDISYQRLYTELASLDALVQRMGRVNRRGEQPQPATVHLLLQYDPRSEYLYEKQNLQQTLALLQQLPVTPTNRELAEAADQLYQYLWQTEEFQQRLQQGRQTLEEVQRICGCYTIDLNDEQMRQRFATRRGEIQVEVLPDRFFEEARRLQEQRALWRLPELLVSVPLWWIYEFAKYFDPSKDLGVPLTDLPYESDIGLAHPATVQGAAESLPEWILL